jgi:hypothetical protein
MDTKKQPGCLARIGASLAGLAVALILIEIFLRLFAPQLTYDRAIKRASSFYRESDWLPFELKPGFNGRVASTEGEEYEYEVHINSLGFRDDEFPIEKPPGTVRVMMLGDSFTFGMGVDDDLAYPALVEDCLADRLDTGPAIDVINAGFASSFSPDSFYVFLREIAPPYTPDVVVVNYFVRNDFADLLDTEWKGERDDLPVRVVSTSRYVDPTGLFRYKDSLPQYQVPVLRNSHAFQLIVGNINNILSVSTIPDWLSENVFRKVYEPELEPELAAAFDTSLRLLDAMQQVSDEHGYQFLVIILPTGAQTNPDLWAKNIKTPYPASAADAYPQRAIRAHLDAAGIAYFDLLPAFWEERPTDSLYIEGDGHWTEAGNRFAAEAVCQFLAESGLLTP